MSKTIIIKIANDTKNLLSDIIKIYPRLLNEVIDFQELSDKDQEIMDSLYERMEDIERRMDRINRNEYSESIPSLNMLIQEMGSIDLISPENESISCISESKELLKILFEDLNKEYGVADSEKGLALTA